MNMDILHDIICDLLVQSGGVPGEEVVPEGKNADVIFHDHKVIAEVKTLTIDRATTSEHYRRALKIISDYRRSIGLDPEKFDVLSEELPQHIGNKIAQDYPKPFKGHITKANKQIKHTRKYTGNSYKGLLVVGLENNYIANEGSIAAFLSQQTKWYSGVDCVLMLTIPANDPPDRPTTVVLSERKSGAIPVELLGNFDARWNAKLEEVYGHKFYRFKTPKGALERDFGLVRR